jgi:hypothetical protein
MSYGLMSSGHWDRGLRSCRYLIQEIRTPFPKSELQASSWPISHLYHWIAHEICCCLLLFLMVQWVRVTVIGAFTVADTSYSDSYTISEKWTPNMILANLLSILSCRPSNLLLNPPISYTAANSDPPHLTLFSSKGAHVLCPAREERLTKKNLD